LYTQKQILHRWPGSNNQEILILQIEGNFGFNPSKTINVWADFVSGYTYLAKGQKITKAKYGVLKSSKKRTKKKHSFFGSIEDTTNCFQDFLTFTLFGVLHLQIPRWLHY
jgi:hypothetical protein